VTVAAADFALGYLRHDYVEAGSPAHQLADTAELLAPHMVKLQHPDVAIPAVHASGLEQRVDHGSCLRDSSVAGSADIGEVPLVVISVLAELAPVADLHVEEARSRHRRLTPALSTGRVVGVRAPLLPVASSLCAALLLAGCASSEPTVATFEVAGEQTYRVELATPELIQHAKDLLAGSQEGRIPNGKIVRDDPSVNAPWSWHIDPTTLDFVDVTTEVCDGLPGYVEDGTLTSDYYCPWSAELIALEGPGAN
jgi:hypothetical protein